MDLAEPSAMEQRPVVMENPDGRSRYVILCDHASNAMPSSVAMLGLSAVDIMTHIAWDPGALPVAQHLAERLDAPLLWPDTSRLIVDCNRAPDAVDLITVSGEGREIPGNVGLTPDQRQVRIDAVHEPYHAAIDALIDERAAAGGQSALVAVHSFTPVFKGEPRPWEVGIIFDKDVSLANQVIEGLRAERSLNVGINQPYSPADRVFYTLDRHGQQRGLPVVMIEIRNDEIAGVNGQKKWAERLAAILEAAE
jgi:predicted N-formylglutamate amidohydrolase